MLIRKNVAKIMFENYKKRVMPKHGGGNSLSFEKFRAFLNEFESNKSITQVAKTSGVSYGAARNIVLSTGLRKEEEIETIRRRTSGQAKKLESLFEGKVYASVVEGLSNPDLTIRQIAERSGASHNTITKINNALKIRLNTKSSGLRIRHAREWAPKKKEIRTLLLMKTPDGNFLYGIGNVASIAKVAYKTVENIAKEVRTAQDNAKRKQQAYPAIASRRETFLRRALKSTLVPMDMIVQRAVVREKAFGGKTNLIGMKSFLKRQSIKMRNSGEFNPKRKRFREGRINSRKVISTLWKKPRPLSSIDFLGVAKKLRMPIYFVRKVYFENMPLFAEKLFEKDRFDFHEIEQITGLPSRQLQLIQSRVNKRNRWD